MILPPPPWPGVVASLLFLAALTLLAVLARRYPGIIRSPRPAPMARIMPVPEPVALPARVPVAWQVPMYEELQSVSPQLSLEVHRLLLLILEKHASAWADELARDLEVARRVVKGELAS